MLNRKTLGRLKNYRNRCQFVLLIFFFILTSIGESVFGHGTVTSPPSRVWTCYQEGPENPNSPACIAAVASHGSQPLYDWNAINQGFADGNHIAVVPNGNLASGGNPTKYGGMDQVRSDWVTTLVTPGPYSVTWTNSAPHASLYFRVYITTDDWSPDQPLSWDKLTLLVETDPSPASNSEDIPLILPSKTGHHVLFSVWQRSDSQEAFYSVSDIMFDGTPPPPPSDDLRVIINDNLEVRKDLTVDSSLLVGSQFINALNPELTFQSGLESKYKITYLNSDDKFTIEELGTGVAFEIKDGEIYLPQYADGSDKLLGIDGNGKIIEGTETGSPSAINEFYKYDFPTPESNQGYNISRIGTHFVEGAVLQGVSSYLLDNDIMTGADDNSVSVKLIRVSKVNNTLPDQVIYEITATTTASEVFSPFSTSTVVYPSSNIIDNITYVYFLEISYCDDCDFREVQVTD